MLSLTYTIITAHAKSSQFAVVFTSCCFVEASILMSLPAGACLATDYLDHRFSVYSYTISMVSIENTASNNSSIVVRGPLPNDGLLVY
jgi:hypothetical protein